MSLPPAESSKATVIFLFLWIFIYACTRCCTNPPCSEALCDAVYTTGLKSGEEKERHRQANREIMAYREMDAPLTRQRLREHLHVLDRPWEP